jgi:hypothetical protein
MLEEEFKAGDEKFPHLNFEKLPQQLQWKMYRAKQHFVEFELAAAKYMNQSPSGPGELLYTQDSTIENPVFYYGTREPVPARFGLIAGDYFQNLRSVFDYLSWQLIIANGKVPGKRGTAFPVCESLDSWKKCYQSRLKGLTPEQISLVKSLQPFPGREKGVIPHPVKIIDELANENKHRQVLFTTLESKIKPNLAYGIPHIEIELSRRVGNDPVPGESLLVYLAFQDGIVKGSEVTATMSGLMDWVAEHVLTPFATFF